MLQNGRWMELWIKLKNIEGMIKGLFGYKYSSVRNNQNLSKCELSRRIANGSCKLESSSTKTSMKSETS